MFLVSSFSYINLVTIGVINIAAGSSAGILSFREDSGFLRVSEDFLDNFSGKGLSRRLTYPDVPFIHGVERYLIAVDGCWSFGEFLLFNLEK